MSGDGKSAHSRAVLRADRGPGQPSLAPVVITVGVSHGPGYGPTLAVELLILQILRGSWRIDHGKSCYINLA